jgi:membrane protein implicated in regulation of membrane protease activity
VVPPPYAALASSAVGGVTAAILFIATAPVWAIGLVFAASVIGSLLLARRWATRYTRNPFEAARQSGMTRPYVRYDWRLRR